MSAFFVALRDGDITQIKSILDAGADINALEQGRTPLTEAIHSGCYQSVELLLERGADVEKKTIGGRTAIIVAALRGREDIVKLLIENGANVNHKDDDGKTALMVAGHAFSMPVFQTLINNGADHGIKDKKGKTAVAWVSSSQMEEALKILREAGKIE